MDEMSRGERADRAIKALESALYELNSASGDYARDWPREGSAYAAAREALVNTLALRYPEIDARGLYEAHIDSGESAVDLAVTWHQYS